MGILAKVERKIANRRWKKERFGIGSCIEADEADEETDVVVDIMNAKVQRRQREREEGDALVGDILGTIDKKKATSRWKKEKFGEEGEVDATVEEEDDMIGSILQKGLHKKRTQDMAAFSRGL